MTSVLALDAVLSATAGAGVVGFTPPSAAGSFYHSSKQENLEEVIIQSKDDELHVSWKYIIT